MALDQIQHVFVLMLENRSFDHLLGFSGITGTDAVTGAQTTVNGLSGTETNSYNGTVGTVSGPADYDMDVDQGHECVHAGSRVAEPHVRSCGIIRWT